MTLQLPHDTYCQLNRHDLASIAPVNERTAGCVREDASIAYDAIRASAASYNVFSRNDITSDGGHYKRKFF